MQGWVDICYVKADRPGIEPATCQRPTAESPSMIKGLTHVRPAAHAQCSHAVTCPTRAANETAREMRARCSCVWLAFDWKIRSEDSFMPDAVCCGMCRINQVHGIHPMAVFTPDGLRCPCCIVRHFASFCRTLKDAAPQLTTTHRIRCKRTSVPDLQLVWGVEYILSSSSSSPLAE